MLYRIKPELQPVLFRVIGNYIPAQFAEFLVRESALCDIGLVVEPAKICDVPLSAITPGYNVVKGDAMMYASVEGSAGERTSPALPLPESP